MTEQQKNIILGGKKLSYTLTRKKVKNINLRIKAGGEIRISAAHSVPIAVIEDFLQKKEQWILSALAQLEQSPGSPLPEGQVWLNGEAVQLPAGSDRLFWQKKMAAELLPAVYERAWQLYEKDGFSKPALKLRRMKSRWGSCIPSKGIITLNTALVGASPDCQLAVAAHELCHMLLPDHSDAFYRTLLLHCPSYMDCWQKLKQTQSFLFYS